MSVTMNDFFCGAGGMALGFKDSGFDIVGAWDNDKYCLETYRHNVGQAEMSDIREMTWKDVPKADVWCFGFPCQDLSVLGERKGLIKGKTRSGLFFEIMRLLEEIEMNDPTRLPLVLLAENVRGLKKYIPTLEDEFQKRNYKMNYKIYNSKFWGVPQSRNRYFVCGVHNSIEQDFEFPQEEKVITTKLQDLLEQEVDPKYFLSEKGMAYVSSEYRLKKKITQIDGDIAVCCTAEGQKNLTGQFIGVQVAKKHEPIFTSTSQTLLARDYKGLSTFGMTCAMIPIESNEEETIWWIRRLTPTEYKRLQGFPEWFEQVVSDTQFYKQMGNAVTVNVAAGVSKKLKTFLESVKSEKTA